MTQQIIEVLSLQASPESVTDVSVEGKMVDFRINGVWYYAKLSRGKFLEKNMRRAAY